MPGSEKLKKLHSNLLNQGYDLPDYNTFEVDMQDDKKLNKLHSSLSGQGYDIPDYNTFKSDMGYVSKAPEVKKKDQPNQLTQEPSIDTSSSASGQSGQSSGQGSSILQQLAQKQQAELTPGTPEYNYRQSVIAKDKAILETQKAGKQPVPASIAKPTFYEKETPEVKTESVNVAPVVAPKSLEEKQWQKNLTDNHLQVSDKVSEEELTNFLGNPNTQNRIPGVYEPNYSKEEVDQIQGDNLFRMSHQEQESIVAKMVSRGVSEEFAREKLASKIDGHIQKSSDELKQDLIFQKEQFLNSINGAPKTIDEIKERRKEAIKLETQDIMDYGYSKLDKEYQELIPVSKEYWSLIEKAKTAKPEEKFEINKKLYLLNEKLKAGREGKKNLTDPITGTNGTKESEVYTEAVNNYKQRYSGTPRDKMIQMYQEKAHEIKFLEGYLNKYKNEEPLKGPSKDDAKTQLRNKKAEFEALSEIMLLNEDPASLERGVFNGLLTSAGKSLAESVGIDVTSNTEIAQRFGDSMNKAGLPLTKEQEERIKSTSAENVGEVLGELPATAVKFVIANRALGAVKGLEAIAKFAESAEAGLGGGKIARYSANIIESTLKGATEGAIVNKALGDENISASMMGAEGFAESLFENIVPINKKWAKIATEMVVSGIGSTTGEYLGDYVENVVSDYKYHGLDTDRAFEKTFGRTPEEIGDKFLTIATVSFLFPGIKGSMEAYSNVVVAKKYFEKTGDRKRLEELDSFAKKNGIDLNKVEESIKEKPATEVQPTTTQPIEATPTTETPAGKELEIPEYNEANPINSRNDLPSNEAKDNLDSEEAKNRNTDLFPDESVFGGASEEGKLKEKAKLSSYREVNGIGSAEYTNPKTGVVDVYVSARNDNSYAAFIRIYDSKGNPTNRFTSKFENTSGSKSDFKQMIQNAQENLPEGHEYTEDTSISTDGLRVYEQQLSRGYEILRDKDGKPVTNEVAINGDSKTNILGIPVPSGFQNISAKTQQEFNKVKEALKPFAEKLGLSENDIIWEGSGSGKVSINLPVLKSVSNLSEKQTSQTSSTTETPAGKETTTTTEETQKQTENENNRGTEKESPTKDFTGDKGKKAEKVRGRGKTPRDKRKIRNEGLKKALASEPKNIRERVLQWFISGGKINTEGFQKLFGDKKTSKWASEARTRINLWDAKKGDTIDGVAHQIWEDSGQTLDIQDIRDQVEDVLLSHNVTVSMAEEINSANMKEEAMYKFLTEQEKEAIDLNEESEDYWDSLTDEEKEIIVNENVLPEDFYKEEKVSPVEKTNTEKAAEAQRMLADKFRKLKIKKPDAGNLFASTPFDLAWDGALEVIAKSLEASASVTEAAGKALEHIKNSDWYKGLTSEQKAKAEQNLKTHIENEMSSFESEQKTTEEPKVSEEPKAGKERETKKRGTVEQLEKDEAHQDMLKDVPESDKEYVTERVAEWDTDAAEIMNSKDISSARSIFDANKIPPFVRVRLGGMLISKYEELASKETNESERTKYLDAAWDVADSMIKMEAGKTLKAFHGMTLLTPQGIVRGIKRQYEDKAKKAKERNKSVINNINDAVKKGRATAAKEVASEAKKKYKEKIKPITTFGLTIDEIKDRKKAALEKLKASRGNLTSGGLSKESIEAISEYGAMLFAEGVHNFKEWASKMKSDIPEVSNSDLSHIWDNTKSLNDKTLKQLSEEGDFETIVSNHFINNPEASLSEKLQEVFGISPEQAESISESLNKDFKKSAKKHVEDAMGKLTTWRKISVEEIINGNLTEKKDISKAILDAKGIKTELTEEQENELLERAKKIQQVPAGSLRNQAMIDLMNDVYKDLGSTSKTDLFMALWYASILSGPETQLVNTISNIMNMASEGYVSAMQRAFKNKNPKELINAIPNFFKNWNEALSESKEVLSNGTKKAVVFNTADSSVLENTKFKNLLYPLNAAKYVGRVMTATDTLFYFKNLDMRKKTLATEIANKEGLSGEALNKRVSDIIYNTEEHIESAMTQAEKDLNETKDLTGKDYNENDIRIRAAEIIDEKIAKEHPELHDQAHSFAAYATFNYDPEGIIGSAAMKIAEFTTAHPQLKFVLPFTRIVANVLNQALDYSPVTGLRRAAGLTSIKNQTPEAKQRRLIKSLTGLMLLSTAYALHEMYSDDEDPAFEITGGGPEDPAKKREWMQTHKPYSVKIGNTYFSYKYSPVGMTMSILGDWIDGFKYNNISEKDTYERAGYALTSSASSIADMSFISTLGGLLEVFSKNDRKGLESKTDKVISLGLRPIAGLVPNAFKQTYGYFDRTVYESKGLKATLLRDLPFVNSLSLKPKLNALGDPIEKWGTRIVANKPDDEIWNFLSEKNVNIPPIGYGTELLGVEMNDDEYYLFVKKTGGKVKEEITRRLPELRLMKSDELREEIKDISDRAKKKSKKEMIKEIGRDELKKRLKK